MTETVHSIPDLATKSTNFTNPNNGAGFCSCSFVEFVAEGLVAGGELPSIQPATQGGQNVRNPP